MDEEEGGRDGRRRGGKGWTKKRGEGMDEEVVMVNGVRLWCESLRNLINAQ